MKQAIDPIPEDTRNLEVATPEHLTLRIPLSGMGSRFIAQMLDDLIRMLMLILVILLFVTLLGADIFGEFFAADSTLPGILLGVVIVLVALGFYLGYDIYYEAYHNGQTPGKKWLNIRVLMDNGQPLDTRSAVSRNIVGIVDSLPSFHLLGGLIALLRDDHKRLGDIVAGTSVVRTQAPRKGPLHKEPDLAGKIAFTGRQLKALGPQDCRMLSELRARARDPEIHMVPGAYRDLCSQIRSNLSRRMDAEGSLDIKDKHWLADLESQLREDLERR